ncbi:MAG TPA: M1 family aminopeptidase, partial [Cyclobacteriaceae bacterium]|nr:M1 family aminopeptidase [Cyclobacteriaceae bacterium]
MQLEHPARNIIQSLTIPLYCFVLAIAFAQCSDQPDKKEIIAGTSRELATERYTKIQNVRYDLALNIPLRKSDSIHGDVHIAFELRGTPSLLQLDFNAPANNIKEVTVNNKSTEPHWENEHVLVDAGDLQEGANSVKIKFIAGDAALNRNEDYLYALFVPARASTCFPVFDQPDLKAIYKLQLDIPSGWEAMSNGAIVETSTSGDRKHIVFSETKPTSTYQFAFTAGKFKVASDSESNMKMLYRETDSIKVAANVKKIFELHRQSLAWLKDYTGIDYPYEKFDFALMPAFQFGGMEHPGNIYYRESSLFLEPSASVNDELRRAGLIAHETAHMWFGNLVTMKWFNDVWLKEVFANFMAGKIVNPGFPQVNHELRFLMSHYPAAYDVDRTAGSHPVQQDLDNLKNAGSVYGAIIYQKAPVTMRNLETLMGEKNFQEGLKEYLNAYAYGNATWDDLIAVMKKHTPQDLEVWNTAWIKSKGMPEIG